MREWDLLEKIYRYNETLPSRVALGPGDDMAIVDAGSSRVLLTVDQLADGVHFDLATTPLEKIGRKAVTRNLSDVASMAAVPVAAVAGACLPRGFDQGRAEVLFEAIRSTCARYDCPLVGGDTAAWEGRLMLSVTVLARPAEGIEPVLRSGAQVGDAVCVTGRLGGSLETIGGYTHHLDFEPRLDLARKLAAWPGVTLHSMIDLSDGLASDLWQICRASGVGAELHAEWLPISEAARVASRRDGLPAWRHAVGDGEDYELCFTVAGDEVGRLPGQIEGVEIRQVGWIVAASGDARVRMLGVDGTWQGLDRLGWEHRD